MKKQFWLYFCWTVIKGLITQSKKRQQSYEKCNLKINYEKYNLCSKLVLYFLNALYFDEVISNERRHTGTVTNEPLAFILDYNISIFSLRHFWMRFCLSCTQCWWKRGHLKTVLKVESFENARSQFLLWTGETEAFKNFPLFQYGR